MKISDFLSPRDVMLDVNPSDKAQLLRELSTRATTQVGLDPDETTTQIAKREDLGSTGVGNGVALPHARLATLKAPFGLFVRLHRAIDFEAVDNRPVDIVFLLLLPESASADGEQLNALACVARALRDPETLQRIRSAADPEALFRALTDPGITA